MAGFFSKLFGGGSKKETSATNNSVVEMSENLMAGIIEKAGLSLEFTVSSNGNAEVEEITFNLQGADAELLIEKDAALLDAIQMFIKRVLQHQMPDKRVELNFDCNGYREEANKSLVELAEKLRDRAIEQGRSVYVRALPPKDRKIVHQLLASDDRVRSRSVGEGLYKKIKIYPVKNNNRNSEHNTAPENVDTTL